MIANTTVNCATFGLKSHFSVDACTTSTPGIVVHPAVDSINAGKWVITVASCGTRLGFAATEEVAQEAATVYGKFPIKWDMIPEFKCYEDMLKVASILRKRLASEPERLAWLEHMQNNGVVPVAKPVPTDSQIQGALSGERPRVAAPVARKSFTPARASSFHSSKPAARVAYGR
jgi:hypothetical protein